MTHAHFSHKLYTEREAERYTIKECLIIYSLRMEALHVLREKEKQEYIKVLTDSSILLPMADS